MRSLKLNRLKFCFSFLVLVFFGFLFFSPVGCVRAFPNYDRLGVMSLKRFWQTRDEVIGGNGNIKSAYKLEELKKEMPEIKAGDFVLRKAVEKDRKDLENILCENFKLDEVYAKPGELNRFFIYNDKEKKGVKELKDRFIEISDFEKAAKEAADRIINNGSGMGYSVVDVKKKRVCGCFYVGIKNFVFSDEFGKGVSCECYVSEKLVNNKDKCKYLIEKAMAELLGRVTDISVFLFDRFLSPSLRENERGYMNIIEKTTEPFLSSMRDLKIISVLCKNCAKPGMHINEVNTGNLSEFKANFKKMEEDVEYSDGVRSCLDKISMFLVRNVRLKRICDGLFLSVCSRGIDLHVFDIFEREKLDGLHFDLKKQDDSTIVKLIEDYFIKEEEEKEKEKEKEPDGIRLIVERKKGEQTRTEEQTQTRTGEQTQTRTEEQTQTRTRDPRLNINLNYVLKYVM